MNTRHYPYAVYWYSHAGFCNQGTYLYGTPDEWIDLREAAGSRSAYVSRHRTLAAAAAAAERHARAAIASIERCHDVPWLGVRSLAEALRDQAEARQAQEAFDAECAYA